MILRKGPGSEKLKLKLNEVSWKVKKKVKRWKAGMSGK